MVLKLTRDKCDFCDSLSVVKRYPCKDFDAESKDVGVLFVKDGETTNVVLASTDYWAACAECVKYVDDGDIDGLIKRVAICFKLQWNKPFLVHLRHMYEMFFKNRIQEVSDASRTNEG